jgi:heme A synthase
VVAAVIGAMVAVALVWAWVYDRRMRRRGVQIAAGREMEQESMHSRVDINAVPYEPARHAGQRDWATYRRRDRKSRW